MEAVKSAPAVRMLLEEAMKNVRAQWPDDIAAWEANPLEYYKLHGGLIGQFLGAPPGPTLMQTFQYWWNICEHEWAVSVPADEWAKLIEWTDESVAERAAGVPEQ